MHGLVAGGYWYVEESGEAGVADVTEREKVVARMAKPGPWSLAAREPSPSSTAYELGVLGQVACLLYASVLSSVNEDNDNIFLIGLLRGWILVKPLERCLAHRKSRKTCMYLCISCGFISPESPG